MSAPATPNNNNSKEPTMDYDTARRAAEKATRNPFHLPPGTEPDGHYPLPVMGHYGARVDCDTCGATYTVPWGRSTDCPRCQVRAEVEAEWEANGRPL